MFDTGPIARTPQAQATRRWIAIGAGAAAIIAIAVGLFTRQVLVDQSDGWSMNCGLKACESHVGTEVITTTTLALTDATSEGGGRATAAWGWSGTIGWWAGIVAIVGLVIAVAMVASRKYVRLPVSPTTIALLGGAAALVCTCIFVATKPEGVGVTRIGLTFWAIGGGGVLSVVGAFLLSGQLALIEPEFDPGESPEAPPDEPWQDP